MPSSSLSNTRVKRARFFLCIPRVSLQSCPPSTLPAFRLRCPRSGLACRKAKCCASRVSLSRGVFFCLRTGAPVAVVPTTQPLRCWRSHKLSPSHTRACPLTPLPVFTPPSPHNGCACAQVNALPFL
ncbi:hypothetical protein TvY486_0009120 [Trypanosoma vivax Y486]|uniref:Uncharacterized protein n=1 Tax=Trypanosoma vivax (strain Y486) TaxID=1055687 RepID=F9WL65_TRYVY|nr:hypothetical protein TvY486_0009120 [Trypanosoma vivax Y486]|eukprot:CCD18252.1 hypothetical protein TvY486_0009120 [Trypanosoma vivax Y486]